MILKSALAAISLILATISLSGVTLVEYGFTSDLSATFTTADITAGDITSGGFFTQFDPGDTTNSGGSSPHLRAAGFGNSPTPTITWTLTLINANDFFDFSAGSFYFDYYITPSGISEFNFQYAVNAGSFSNLLTDVSVSRSSTWLSSSSSLLGIGQLNAGDSISFRFTNGDGSNGSALNLDTFRINGDLVAIPESASTSAFLGLFGVIILVGRVILGRVS